MNYEKNGFTDITHEAMEEHSAIAKGSFCTGDGFESSTHGDVKDNGSLECRVQVRN